jgi:hypothetical protein
VAVIRIELMLRAALVIGTVSLALCAEELSVELDRNVMEAPGILRMTVIVSRDDVNRFINVEAESATYYRSSEIPLNGAGAPRRHRIVYRDLPEGEYKIRVELRGVSDLLAVARRSAVVRGDATEPFLADCDEAGCPR